MQRNRSKPKTQRTMPMVHANAAAIDIGATMHMAAVRADRTSEPVRSFGTFTTDLHRLVDWFTECGVETVVMESTSVYWIPIFELLDARGFTVFLVNARDAKHVPGRKTDVSDSGCNGFIRTVCYVPAFGQKARLPSCVHMCVSASVCLNMGLHISSTCRKR
jgi:transposase